MDATNPDWNEAETGAIRRQLEKLLLSELFNQAPRQGRFIEYVVEEELAGRGKRLNQYAIATEVFDRDETFDPLVDSIVRVEARRLRSKLAEYYAGEGRVDAIVISLPKGCYRVNVRIDSADLPADPSISTRPTAAARTAKPSVAVLPFDNLSGDPEQEYFSDGITEDIITDLSKISDLVVISRHSTFVYKGKAARSREISDDLGAQYLLEGSVRKAGERIRISAQMIDASSDDHLWAERYDRDLDDIFAIQDDVAQKIVEALKLQLTGAEKQRLGHKGTSSTEAHDLLLRAQEQFYQFTPETINAAIGLLSDSIAVDSEYTEAYAWKSRVLIFTLIAGSDPSEAGLIQSALALASKAVSLDDLLPLGHASLGWALLWHREISAAVAKVNRALELDPNFADGYCWHSLAMSSAGRGEDALDSIERAVGLNPYYTVTYLMAIGIAHFTLERYEEALTAFERGIRRNPKYFPNHLFKAAALGLLGRTQEAKAAGSRLLELDQSLRAVREAFFYNDEQALKRFQTGLDRAGISQP
jgi:TolB-like protein